VGVQNFVKYRRRKYSTPSKKMPDADNRRMGMYNNVKITCSIGIVKMELWLNDMAMAIYLGLQINKYKNAG
jgi:hypothetical protein